MAAGHSSYTLVHPCPRCGSTLFRDNCEHGTEDPDAERAWVGAACAICGLIYEYDTWQLRCGGPVYHPGLDEHQTWAS